MAKSKTEEVKNEVKTAARKAAGAAKKTATSVKKAAPKKPEVYLQCFGKEVDVEGVVTAAKAAFKAESRAAVKSCKVYLKPEENAAYYVINDTFEGKIEL